MDAWEKGQGSSAWMPVRMMLRSVDDEEEKDDQTNTIYEPISHHN